MTSKRSRETGGRSRSAKTDRGRSVPNHYAEAEPAGSSEAHPVDIQVDGLPDIAARRRRFGEMLKALQRQVADQLAFIRLMDAKLEYSTLRERTFFNVGFERGLVAGRAESREASKASRALAHQIGLAVATTDICQPHTAAALLDLARAIVLGLPIR